MSRLETEVPTDREFTLPEGCLVCGGDLPIRVTASGATAVCLKCGFISRPVITVKRGGLEVNYRTATA